MGKKIEAWTRDGDNVSRATGDDTTREFYENTFLFNEFSECFADRFRFIQQYFLYFVVNNGGFIEKYNTEDSSPLWSTGYEGSIRDIKVDSSDRILVAISDHIKVLNKDGSEALSIDVGEQVNCIVHDDDLTIVAGTNAGTVTKFDSDGNPLWTRTQDAGGSSYNRIANIAMKPNGQIIASTQLTYSTVAHTINSDGSAWINSSGSDELDTYGFDRFCITDSQGNIYVFEEVRI